MTLPHDWKQAGSTGRAHLVARLERKDVPTGFVRANMSACGMVRFAAWMPEAESGRCGLCRRLAVQAERRGDPVAKP